MSDRRRASEDGVFPTLPKDFPRAAHVTPRDRLLKAADGFEIHNQLFLPKDIKPGERRPAIVFVHGGPVRQMLPATTTCSSTTGRTRTISGSRARATSCCRSTTGAASATGSRSATRRTPEAAATRSIRTSSRRGKYLQARADVDPTRVGIWGLSYGGLLTAQALARNSDIFVAGVDMAGVHLYGSSLDTTDVSYQSSAISAIDTWKSPVLLWQGDDDRNVEFSQTIGLVDLLRARNVYYELIVIPDDTHESLLHSRWLYLYGRMEDFLRRKIWEKKPSETSSR